VLHFKKLKLLLFAFWSEFVDGKLKQSTCFQVSQFKKFSGGACPYTPPSFQRARGLLLSAPGVLTKGRHLLQILLKAL